MTSPAVNHAESYTCGSRFYPVSLITFLLLTLLSVSKTSLAQEAMFPDRPLTIVVAFGVGGSADRMTRLMSGYIADALGQPVNVLNRPGAGTLLGANYFLSRPDDGYTVFASGFSPYLINTVLNGSANYSIEDFAYVNFQWFDEDLIALNKDAPYQNLEELLEAIRSKPKTVKAAVVKGSAGHLTVNLLLEANGIPLENLNLVTYNGGGLARSAVAGGVVDFIVISAKGCESIGEYLRPLAVNNNVVNDYWQAPPLNDLLAPLGSRVAVLPGSIRGFAMSKAVKERYPERFEVIRQAIQQALADPELQELLDRAAIGRRWIGPDDSDALMIENFELYRNYSHLW